MDPSGSTVSVATPTVINSAVNDKQLTSLLLENEILSEAELKQAADVAEKEKISLSEALIEKDLVSDENLGRLISDYLKVPFVTLAQSSIPDTVLRIVPEEFARKQRLVVFDSDQKEIKVATSNPKNTLALELLARKTGSELKTFYATDRDIDRTLKLYKKKLQNQFDELFKGLSEGKIVDLPIAKIVDTLIEYAYDSRASDVHIEPNEFESLIRFRIDGILHDQLKVPKTLHEQIVTRIKVLSKLRTDEHLSAQDGKMQIKLKEENVDIRVSIVPIVEGEKCVLRLLTSKYRSFGLTDLGMNEADLKKDSRWVY